MAAKKQTTAVATTSEEQKELALPMGWLDDADAGGGLEGADKDSFATPFLRVLQKISPQCDEGAAEYIEGAKGGMLFDSVSGTLYDGRAGLVFLPCAYQRRFLQWAPRGSDGAGFKGEVLPEDVAAMRSKGAVQEFEGKLLVADRDGEVSEKRSDRLADTRSHFGLVLDEETGLTTRALLALSSTQIKKSKQLMTILSNARIAGPRGTMTPPTWMNKIRITSVLESNDQGSWYGVRFESEGFIESEEAYAAGKAFHAAIVAGEAKANFAAEEPVASDKF